MAEENNHPDRYTEGKGLECIEVMKAIKGWFKTAVFCELNDFKYNWRLGKKQHSPIHKDMEKEQWYTSKCLDLWKEQMHWVNKTNSDDVVAIVTENISHAYSHKPMVLYTNGSFLKVMEKLDFYQLYKNVNVDKTIK